MSDTKHTYEHNTSSTKGGSAMASETKKHISGLLLSNKKHARYLGILACLAILVAFGVTMGLRQDGQAATHTVQVLDCHYTGNGAHTHDQSCYDEYGQLVCPLQERELHTHTDACYQTKKILVCGQDESSGHTHTDACYKTETTLICDKQEVTEQHVHGPGCFTAIVVEDGSEADASSEMPAHTYIGEMKKKLADGTEETYLVVTVEAPEGAFPAGTTMQVKAVPAKDIAGAVDKAVADKTDAKVTDIQAVDITFFDVDGNEIEPAKKIQVKFTSDLIADNKDPLIVHVDDNGKADLIDTLTDEELVRRDQEPNDNELSADVDEFSAYGIVIMSTEQKLEASDDKTFAVTVDVPANAGIPQNSALQVEEILPGSQQWSAYLSKVQEELSADVAYARFFDISIVKNGQKMQPDETVSVQIDLSDANEIEEDVTAVHFADDGLEQLDARLDGETVSFNADGFSIYAIVGTSTNKRMTYKFYNGNDLINSQYVKKNPVGVEPQYEELYDPGVVAEYGQKFIGWAENANETNDSKIYTIDELNAQFVRPALESQNFEDGDSKSFYAIFEEAYYLRYMNQDENGNVTILKTEAYPKDGTEAERTANIDFKFDLDPGEIFKGWYDPTTAHAYSEHLYAGEDSTSDTIVMTGHLDLYLQVQDRYWLVFDANAGGPGSGATYTAPQLLFSNKSDITKKPTDPQWIGYTFKGWNTKADGTGTWWLKVGSNDPTTGEVSYTINNFGSELTDDVLLYAQWEADDSFYRIAYWRQKETDAVGLSSDKKTYDFYGYREISEGVKTGQTVSASNNDTKMTWVAEQLGKKLGDEGMFSYNSSRSDTGSKTVAGDGSTVINIYFDRATMSFVFDKSVSHYVATTDSTGTLYGYIDGEFIRVTADGNGGYYYQKYVNYTGTRYTAAGSDHDNNPNKYYFDESSKTMKRAYDCTRYSGYQATHYWNTRSNGNGTTLEDSKIYAPTQNNTGTQYAVVNGSFIELVNNDGTWQYAQGARMPYAGTVYKYESISNKTLKGLYGSQMKPGEWPDGTWSFSNNENGTTKLNAAWTAYTIPTSAKQYGGTTWNLSSTTLSSGTTVIYWRQDTNGDYPASDTVTTELAENSTLYVGNNKFYGFSMYGWRYDGEGGTPNPDGDGWNDLTHFIANNESDTISGKSAKSHTVNIYYNRDKFDVTFQSNDAHSNVRVMEDVFYEKSLSDLKSFYTPADSDGPEGYYFAGWYKDASFTQEFDFDNEVMPHNDIVLYGKWSTYRVRTVLIPTRDNAHNDEVQFANNQSLSFRLDYNEKVSDANINSSVAKRLGYKLIGWYTSPTYEDNTLWSFDTAINKRVAAVDMNYQQSEDWENNTYGDNDGLHQNVEGILKLYAKWEVNIEENAIYVAYEVPERYVLRNTLGNLLTTIPYDNMTYRWDADTADPITVSVAEAPTNYNEAFEFSDWVFLNADGSESETTSVPGDSHTFDPTPYITEREITDDFDNTATMKVIVLRAEFKPTQGNKATKVTYIGNGGTYSGDVYTAGLESVEETYQVNEGFQILDDESFTRKGYELVGWAFDENLAASDFDQAVSEGNAFACGAEVAADNLVISTLNDADNTLYAVWKAIPYTVTVKQVVLDESASTTSFSYQFAGGLTDQFNLVGTTVEGDGTGNTYNWQRGQVYAGTSFELPGGQKDNYELLRIMVQDDQGPQDVTAAGKVAHTVYSDVVITFTYRPMFEVTVKKTALDGETGLTKATFTLNKLDDQGEFARYREASYTVADSGDAMGTFAEMLETGVYEITETVAPDGYVILSNKVYFRVDRTSQGLTTLTLCKEQDGAQPGESAWVAADASDYPLVSVFGGSTIIIKNEPGEALPMTGGRGTAPFYVLGTAIVVAAILAYGLISRRSGERRSM